MSIVLPLHIYRILVIMIIMYTIDNVDAGDEHRQNFHLLEW